MSDRPNVGVIGCGIFGAMVALRLSAMGWRVTVFEGGSSILGGASYNNQNRLHLGFHYPRDRPTALQCKRGFRSFVNTFPEAILAGFPNAYFIASEGSRTGPEAYLRFCEACGLEYEEIAPGGFPVEVNDVALGLLTGEVVYDCAILRRSVNELLERSSVAVKLGHKVTAVERVPGGFSVRCEPGGEARLDAVVNCAYADMNRLTRQLGHPVPEGQYEYTLVPIIDWLPGPVGVTVMDGPFFTVLPFGKTGKHLLYHVEHTVIARETGALMNATGWTRRGRPRALRERKGSSCGSARRRGHSSRASRRRHSPATCRGHAWSRRGATIPMPVLPWFAHSTTGT